MQVKDLIRFLQDMDENKDVILASDEEGNSFGTVEVENIEIYKDYIIFYPYDENIELN